MNKKFTRLLSDHPIRGADEDVLEREKVAKHFAKTLLNLDRSEGVVASIWGPWGAGKTSFFHLVAEQLKQQPQIDILEFNPWMFSGTKQLIRNFFRQISAQMTSDERDGSLVRIGNLFLKYGVSETFFHGATRGIKPKANHGKTKTTILHILDFCTRLFGKKIQKRISKKPQELREQIENALNERDNRPIIVVIDDIDRLPAQEIQDVFQLVRLTASFPNLIYVVICDRAQVEKALKRHGVSGRDYLEKIIQFPFDLPPVSREKINEQTGIAIEQVLSVSASPGLFDMSIWLEIYYDIILPLIQNIRDIRRYSMAIQQALIYFDQEIEQVDILALEAIRLFLPDVFKLLPEAIDVLTIRTAGQRNNTQTESIAQAEIDEISASKNHHERRIQKLIDAGKSQSNIVRGMLCRLFPAAQNPALNFYDMPGSREQLQNRRVAHENILRLYLEQTTNSELLAFNDARQALQAIGNKTTFENFWRQRDPKRWVSIIHYLERCEDEFLPEWIDSGVAVLFNLIPSMPTQPLHSHHVNRLAVVRVVLRIFRKIKSVDTIEASMRRILMEINTLSSKIDMIELVGYRNGVGNELVSEVAAKKFEKSLCQQILSTSSENLSKERDLAHLVWFAKFNCGINNHSYKIENSPKLTYALLRSSQTQASESFLGSRNVRLLEPTIDWDALSKLYDNPVALITCIKTLDMEFEKLKTWFESQDIPISEAQQTLALAREYIKSKS